MITEINGDLFSVPLDFSLAHCVSVDLRMGAGIALAFREKFGRISELKQQSPEIGSCLHLIQGQRYLFYLITKQFYFEKPSYADLTLALIGLCNFCLNRKITKLALPRIGCGLDRLNWSKVKEILVEVFSGTEIEIRICSL